jgi:hypothetical protein
MPPLSADDRDEIRRLYAKYGNKTEVARRSGRSRHSVIDCLKDEAAVEVKTPYPDPTSHGWREIPDMPGWIELTPEAKQKAAEAIKAKDPLVVEQEKIGVKRFRDQARELTKTIAKERAFRDFLEELVRDTAPHFPAPPSYRPPVVHRSASVETMWLCLSDWHAYEEVDKNRVLGLNEYNAEVFARRVKRVVDATLSIKGRMEKGQGWSFPSLVVSANGDFVSGTIHEAERHMDAPDICMAVYGCGMTLAAALRDLAARFEEVTVYCTSGNHGRLPDARKMQSKDPTRNWDTLIYFFAREALRDLTHVKFVIPDSYAVTFQIGSKTVLQYHGHAIKSWSGIPHYGISRYIRNMSALRARKERPIDYALISHFHADAKLPTGSARTFVNGSLIGGNEYSVESLGEASEASQKLLCVKDSGITSEWELFGDPPAGEEPGDSYPKYPWSASQ